MIRFNVRVKDKHRKGRYVFVEWVGYERAEREFESWVALLTPATLVCRRHGKVTVLERFDPSGN
jgi:hypothetical protein